MRTVDSTGRVSIGKDHAGSVFNVVNQENGDVLLQQVLVVPVSEASPDLQQLCRDQAELVRKNLGM